MASTLLLAGKPAQPRIHRPLNPGGSPSSNTGLRRKQGPCFHSKGSRTYSGPFLCNTLTLGEKMGHYHSIASCRPPSAPTWTSVKAAQPASWTPHCPLHPYARRSQSGLLRTEVRSCPASAQAHLHSWPIVSPVKSPSHTIVHKALQF